MKEKTQEEKDKEIREAIDYTAERLAHILWEHWLWLQRKKNNKAKKKDS